MAISGRLSRPVYEGLPWAYLTVGLAALAASYLHGEGAMSLLVGVAGFLGLLGGIVVLLRRRDSRAMRARYGNPVSLSLLTFSED
jgi:hypothetical protein